MKKGNHFKSCVCGFCKPNTESINKAKCSRRSYKGAKNPNWKGGDIEFICINCLNKFYVKRDRISNQKGLYCSVKCYFDYIAKIRLPYCIVKLHSIMKTSVQDSLKGNKLGKKWVDLVGYTEKDLLIRIESQFKEGMSWANYGEKWEIDHIVPKSLFKFKKPTDAGFKECWGLHNLRPLWKEENMKKSGGFKFLQNFTVISVDNGITGSFTILNKNNIRYFKIPVLKELNYTKKRQSVSRIDGVKLRELLLESIMDVEMSRIIVCIERPMINPIRFKSSLSASRALESILIILEEIGLPYIYIDSKEWQKEMLPNSVGKDLKKDALLLACALYPKIAKTMKNGDADSLIMGLYLKRKYTGGYAFHT